MLKEKSSVILLVCLIIMIGYTAFQLRYPEFIFFGGGLILADAFMDGMSSKCQLIKLKGDSRKEEIIYESHQFVSLKSTNSSVSF